MGNCIINKQKNIHKDVVNLCTSSIKETDVNSNKTTSIIKGESNKLLKIEEEIIKIPENINEKTKEFYLNSKKEIYRKKEEIFKDQGDIKKLIVSKTTEDFTIEKIKKTAIDYYDFCGIEILESAESQIDKNLKEQLIENHLQHKLHPFNFFEKILKSNEGFIDPFKNYEEARNYLALKAIPNLYRKAIEKGIAFSEFPKELSEEIIRCEDINKLLALILKIWTMESPKFYKIINVLMNQEESCAELFPLLRIPLYFLSLNFNKAYGLYSQNIEKCTVWRTTSISKRFWCTSYNKNIINNNAFKNAKNFLKIKVYPNENAYVSSGFFTNTCIEAYSVFPNESEVLFLPFCEFRIEKSVERNLKVHVKLLQIFPYENMALNFFILQREELLKDLKINYWPYKQIISRQVNLRVMEDLFQGVKGNLQVEDEYLFMKGVNYQEMGLMENALDCNLERLEVRRKLYGEESEVLASDFGNIGMDYEMMGQHEVALGFLLKAIAIDRKFKGEEHPDIPNKLNNVGMVYDSIGEYEAALKCYREAIAMDKKFKGEEHPDIAASLSNIGHVYDSMGQYDEALKNYREALIIDKKFKGDEHPDIANILNSIGMTYNSLGEYEEAIRHYREALAMDKKLRGEEHSQIATYLNNIAGIYETMEHYEEALQHYQKALAIDKKLKGEEHPDIAIVLSNIGMVFLAIGEHEKALKPTFEALAIDKKFFGEKHPDIAIRLHNIGLVYKAMGQYEEALKYYLDSLAIDKSLKGEEHPDFATKFNNIGRIYFSMEQYEEAAKFFEESLEIFKKFAPEHPNVASVLQSLGNTYSLMGKIEKALEILAKALIFAKKFYGEESEKIKNIEEEIEVLKKNNNN